MPLAVFEGPITGTLARSAIGSAENACCESVGPMIATALSVLIRLLNALIAPCSSPAVSCITSLIGRPLTPPFALKNASAICAPITCSCPSSATLLVCATAMPIGIASPDVVPVDAPACVGIPAAVGALPDAAVGEVPGAEVEAEPLGD